jgi:hypothetical protein
MKNQALQAVGRSQEFETVQTMPFAKRAGLVFAALLLACVPILAHHGTQASYDPEKLVTLTGTVTEFLWTNPHSQIHWDVKGPDGKVVNWGGELHSIAQLLKSGWSKNLIKPGDEVTVTGHPSRAGTPYMVVTVVKLVNGKEYFRDAPEQGR